MNSRRLEGVKERLRPYYYYALIRRPKNWGWLPSDEEKLMEALKQNQVPVHDLSIRVADYRDYFDKAGYATRYPTYYPWNITEKSLEHFIAQQLLELQPSDTYIDIASEGSPVPEIYQRLFGCTTYAQDLSYEKGIHGNRIGSDAASMPLPNGSVTKMALHCSFEHFEDDSDTGFIREVARVLGVGGKMVIVPLYLSSTYSILTDPMVSRKNNVPFGKEAVVVAVRGWGNRHGRMYDASHLVSRVLTATEKLKFELIRLINTSEVSESAYARFALLGTKVHD